MFLMWLLCLVLFKGGVLPQTSPVIAGRVMELQTHTPIPGAIVRATNRQPGGTVSAVTDASGNFVLSDVPIGHVVVSAAYPGFLVNFYGERFSGDDGLPISSDDPDAKKLELYLTLGGVATGRVTDEHGDPTEGALVSLTDDSGKLIASVQADDRGVFRFAGLGSGVYSIVARRPSFASQVPRQTASTVDALLKWLQAGKRTAMGAPGVDAVASAPVEDVGRAEIAVNAGSETTTDLRLLPVTFSALTGTIVGLRPNEHATVQLFAKRAAGDERSVAETSATANGEFALPQAEAGDYTLLAISRGRDGAGKDFVAGYARSDYALGATGQQNVVLSLSPPIELAGRLAPDTPAEARSLSVLLTPIGETRQERHRLAAPMDAAGGFRLTGIVPGRYLLGVGTSTGAPLNWSVDHITHDDGRSEGDVLILDHTSDGVTLKLAPAGAGIRGLLRPADLAVAAYDVVIFATDPRLWFRGSPRVTSTRIDSKGAFQAANLSPGDYYIAVVSNLTRSDLYMGDSLGKLERGAIRVSLVGGQVIRQDLLLTAR